MDEKSWLTKKADWQGMLIFLFLYYFTQIWWPFPSPMVRSKWEKVKTAPEQKHSVCVRDWLAGWQWQCKTGNYLKWKHQTIYYTASRTLQHCNDQKTFYSYIWILNCWGFIIDGCKPIWWSWMYNVSLWWFNSRT